MTEPQQPEFDTLFDWSAAGAVLLARVCPVVVVVDVLRFATAVEVGVARGAVVLAGCLRAADLRLAAEHDVSRVVPRLAGGGFAQLS